MTDTSDNSPSRTGKKKDQKSTSNSNPLGGTTLRVYRFLYRQGGKPLGIHEIQRGCGLSSPSLAQYHIRKLHDAGLIKEQDSGYVVDRVLFENMIRIRRSIVPLQVTFSAFFLTTLILLLTLLRPHIISTIYIFAVVINLAAIIMFGYETFNASRQNSI